MHTFFAIELKQSKFLLIVLLQMTTEILFAQNFTSDSIAMRQLITEFKESIIQKDSVRFNALFFKESVNFTGIMSKKTERSIKKNYPEFEGAAISDNSRFIRDICNSDKKQEEKFYNVKLFSDSAIGAISFDYAFYVDDKMM